MGRRILAVLAALLVLLWAAVPAYAASPAVDRAYLTREPWQNVPVTEFRADGAMGYYQIYADTDNHCLYFAVSMQDQQVEPGANTAAVALNLQVSSAKFSTKKFTFTTGADKALQSYDGISSSCNMQVEILENSGGYGIADGNAYFAIALDKSLCGPLTVRLIGLLIIALRVRVLLIVLVHLVLPLFLKNVQNSASIAYHTWH